MRDACAAAFATRAATAQTGHFGCRARFVEEHKLGRIKVGLKLKPGFAPGGYIRAFLLAGVRGLFL